MTFYDDQGDAIRAEDVLDREELADYYASQRSKPRRRRDRGVALHAPATWEPTEVDRHAGRTE